jgi:hypothetical protein
MITMAYFDLALYDPTNAVLNAINDRMVPRSLIVMDKLNDPRYHGVTMAFREWAKEKTYEIKRFEILPDRTSIIPK